MKGEARVPVSDRWVWWPSTVRPLIRRAMETTPLRAAFELRPVYDALIADLKRSTKLFMDEDRALVLDPGAGKTKKG